MSALMAAVDDGEDFVVVPAPFGEALEGDVVDEDPQQVVASPDMED